MIGDSHLDIISTIFGYVSIFCWLGAQFPQIIVNIQNQSVEGLALPFLANWFAGDFTNLVGCILTNQLPFQTYLATYFVFVDFSLFVQYVYYYRRPAPCESSQSSGVTTPVLSVTTPLLGDAEAGYRTYDGHSRTRRWSGVSAHYPPAGLLPSTEELVQARSRSRSANTLGRRRSLQVLADVASNLAAGARQEAERLQKERIARRKERFAISRTMSHATMSSVGAPAQDEEVYKEEEGDEVGNLTESFHSEAGIRHVSWSHSATPTAGPSNPPTTSANTSNLGLRITPTSHDQLAPPSPLLPDRPHHPRSRSRGRPSTRPIPPPVYDSPMEERGPSLTSRQEGSLTGSLRGSSSRKRSASIVFLSVGAGAFWGFSQSGNTGTAARSMVSRVGRLLQPIPESPLLVQLHDNDDTRLLPSSSPQKPLYYSDLSFEADRHRERHHKPQTPIDPGEGHDRKRMLIGRISAWLCTTLYLTSRLPQIWKNYVRKSVQGLSMALFVSAFLGNTFYTLSIMSAPVVWAHPVSEPSAPSTTGSPLTPEAHLYLREKLPFLLGSAGTLMFDIIIVSQGIVYSRRERERERDKEDEEDDGSGSETESDDEDSGKVHSPGTAVV